MCPVIGCKKEVNSAGLARHMKLVHRLSREEAKGLSYKYGTRKPYTWKNRDAPPKQKDYHAAKKCPIKDCGAVVKRIVPHLTKVHKLVKSDPYYIVYRSHAHNVKSRSLPKPESAKLLDPSLVADCETSKPQEEDPEDEYIEDEIGSVELLSDDDESDGEKISDVRQVKTIGSACHVTAEKL